MERRQDAEPPAAPAIAASRHDGGKHAPEDEPVRGHDLLVGVGLGEYARRLPRPDNACLRSQVLAAGRTTRVPFRPAHPVSQVAAGQAPNSAAGELAL